MKIPKVTEIAKIAKILWWVLFVVVITIVVNAVVKNFWITFPMVLGSSLLIMFYQKLILNPNDDKNVKQPDTNEVYAAREKEIIRIAVNKKGLVTPTDVAMSTELSLEHAKKYLEYLKESGFVRLKIANNGTYVYEFMGILTEDEKKKAEAI
ncbi:hypothetical protein [Paenibacillus radicibacter]|uniref:hypothetical protein n=1 Tax=Paenibacillus radicibacter TaxID=2972488 RepID=UPI002159267C|nr:hypothetical protein [Paenibacillus radicibacter]